jgi:hypothetical protein
MPPFYHHDFDSDDTNSGSARNQSEDDIEWLSADKAMPPEHFLQHLQEFDDSEFTKHDYAESSVSLLDQIEDQWKE